MGAFGPWNGLLTDWMTPGFEVGLRYYMFMYTMSIKYRGVLYNDVYAHSIGLGMSMSLY